MKCLFGIYGKDEGKIFLEGKEVSFKSSKEATVSYTHLDVYKRQTPA